MQVADNFIKQWKYEQKQSFYCKKLITNEKIENK